MVEKCKHGLVKESCPDCRQEGGEIKTKVNTDPEALLRKLYAYGLDEDMLKTYKDMFNGVDVSNEKRLAAQSVASVITRLSQTSTNRQHLKIAVADYLSENEEERKTFLRLSVPELVPMKVVTKG